MRNTKTCSTKYKTESLFRNWEDCCCKARWQQCSNIRYIIFSLGILYPRYVPETFLGHRNVPLNVPWRSVLYGFYEIKWIMSFTNATDVDIVLFTMTCFREEKKITLEIVKSISCYFSIQNDFNGLSFSLFHDDERTCENEATFFQHINENEITEFFQLFFSESIDVGTGSKHDVLECVMQSWIWTASTMPRISS